MAYVVVTVFNLLDPDAVEKLQIEAMGRFESTGIEEYSLSEEAVDSLLGSRSYSGGDLPQEVLDEVDARVLSLPTHRRYYFKDSNEVKARDFVDLIHSRYLCEAKIDVLSDQDWNLEWKKHYSPIKVTDSFYILPEWVDIHKYTDKNYVRIYPGMGFGTGSHETTFLCLKHFLSISSVLNQPIGILDYGSGSGILGLSALITLPESKADMVDIDLEAHDNCLQNILLNGLDRSRVQLLMVNERPNCRYQVVFANILQVVLHEDRDYLIDRVSKNGFLILSGLLKSQVQETLALYLEDQRLALVSSEIKGDWGALLLRRLN
jgi:ribosomal protein L11 methyltransferase